MKKPLIIGLLGLNFLGFVFGDQLISSFLDQVNSLSPNNNKTVSSPDESVPSSHARIKGVDDLYFKYPRSTIISQETSKLTFNSFDDPEKITDWYKQKIEERGMFLDFAISVNTDGNIRNRLIGVNDNLRATIEIKKLSEEKTVTIDLSISST